MDLKRIKQLRDHYETLPIDELLKLWEQNDREQYTDETFEAVKQLLEGHGVIPPTQQQIEDNAKISDTDDEEKVSIWEAGFTADELITIGNKYCPRCNTGYDQAKNFCGRCGVPLSARSVKTANLTDEELEKIVVEDFNKYSASELAAAIQELKKRGYEIGSDVSEAIDEYVSVANLSDEKLIEITENFWNHPTSVLELAYQQLEKRKIKIEEKIFKNGVTDGSDLEEDS